MDELAFEGVPLPQPAVAPAGVDGVVSGTVAVAPVGAEGAVPDVAPPGAADEAPSGATAFPPAEADETPWPVGETPPPGTITAASLTARLAERLQRTHARVMTAHQSLIAWQLARATPCGAPHAAHRAPAPARETPREPPREAPRVTALAAVRPVDPVVTLLRAAARALRAADARLFPGSAVLTWLEETPRPADTVACVEQDGTAWRIEDGAGALAVLTPHGPRDSWPEPPVHRFPPEPRPAARTTVTCLTGTDLDALADGDAAHVLGPAFDLGDRSATARPAPWPARLLEGVTLVDPRGGRHAHGLLHATTRLPVPGDEDGREEDVWPHCVAAALEALRVHAFHQGFHLCLPGARATVPVRRPVLLEVCDTPVPPGATLFLRTEIVATGMVPRPYVTADCRITVDGRLLAVLRDLSVVLKEAPGEELLSPRQPGHRTGTTGRRLLADELHTAHFAEGDLSVAPLPGSTTRVTGRVRPRLPRGDFRMLDRVTDADGDWEAYRPGSRGVFEYDVPPDPWYVRENGGTMPQLALMETALQAAGLFSGGLGVAGAYPDGHLSCRNLDGRARLLRDVDTAGTTVEQHVTLRSHSPLPGGVMHRYDFQLQADGRPYYAGEAVHGFFTPELLAEQQGLDGGACRPPWLERHPRARTGARGLDPRHEPRLGHGRLALLENVTLVPDGGEHGAGYVLCDKPVRRDDWFFHHHFFQDPVMPGSAGVQMLYQAVHAHALHTGLLAHLSRPRPHIALGEELHWSYRGQILREHQRVRGEVHIRDVHRGDRRVLLRADGSVWRDDLRIYQVDNIAVDIRDDTA
ncbi:3-hydroxyacyl-ACP dehydratase [Streptomyces sp. NPDC003077]|uniref:3-hydroxyacyl-ACP dehydratase n=1 Tax=Streptomyces sp. NPDC003077 TaxID=3154443 RepID=UPI0033BC452A